MDLFQLQSRGCCIEVVMFLLTVRFIWSQWLPSNFSKARSYPLSYYILVKRQLQVENFKDRLHTLKSTPEPNLRNRLESEAECRSIVLKYNLLLNSSRLPLGLGLAMVNITLAYAAPWVLISFFLSDALLARLHHLVVISL